MATALTVTHSASAAGPALLVGGGTGLAPFYSFAFELGPWKEYLARELTPEFALADNVAEIHVSWLGDQSTIVLPEFLHEFLTDSRSTFLQLHFDRRSDAQFQLPQTPTSGVLSAMGPAMQRDIFAPELVHQISDNSTIGVSAVLAYQTFSNANLGMGLWTASQPDDLFDYDPYDAQRDSSYGTGVRLAMRKELTPGMAFDAGFQSRIDMDPFASARGVYNEQADVDIPAKAHLGMELQTGQKTALRFGVDHVMYSQVTPFPSRALPARFLALLGDSSSPVFGWEDLTVYSLGWRWRAQETGSEWRVDFSTRQQPSPTSALLDRALENELADNSVSVGYSRRTSDRAQFNLTAAYASPEYAFGGNVLGLTSDELGQTLEVEALWLWQF